MRQPCQLYFLTAMLITLIALLNVKIQLKTE